MMANLYRACLLPCLPVLHFLVLPGLGEESSRRTEFQTAIAGELIVLTLLGNIRAQISVLVGLRVFRKRYTPTGEPDQGCGLGTKAKNKELRKTDKLNMHIFFADVPFVVFSEVSISVEFAVVMMFRLQ